METTIYSSSISTWLFHSSWLWHKSLQCYQVSELAPFPKLEVASLGIPHRHQHWLHRPLDFDDEVRFATLWLPFCTQSTTHVSWCQHKKNMLTVQGENKGVRMNSDVHVVEVSHVESVLVAFNCKNTHISRGYNPLAQQHCGTMIAVIQFQYLLDIPTCSTVWSMGLPLRIPQHNCWVYAATTPQSRVTRPPSAFLTRKCMHLPVGGCITLRRTRELYHILLWCQHPCLEPISKAWQITQFGGVRYRSRRSTTSWLCLKNLLLFPSASPRGYVFPVQQSHLDFRHWTCTGDEVQHVWHWHSSCETSPVTFARPCRHCKWRAHVNHHDVQQNIVTFWTMSTWTCVWRSSVTSRCKSLMCIRATECAQRGTHSRHGSKHGALSMTNACA